MATTSLTISSMAIVTSTAKTAPSTTLTTTFTATPQQQHRTSRQYRHHDRHVCVDTHRHVFCNRHRHHDTQHVVTHRAPYDTAHHTTPALVDIRTVTALFRGIPINAQRVCSACNLNTDELFRSLKVVTDMFNVKGHSSRRRVSTRAVTHAAFDSLCVAFCSTEKYLCFCLINATLQHETR
jgi:hypothetical protein